jgi:SAM-dependent methyltransferase
MGVGKMQREKTLQFWDDFYLQQKQQQQHPTCQPTVEHQHTTTTTTTPSLNPDASKEWVLHPTQTLLQEIVACIPLDRDIAILEIGCGTSTLARDLYLYLRSREPRFQRRVVAIDVSRIGIEQVQERDALLCQQSQGAFSYHVLNVAMEQQDDVDSVVHTHGPFDVILDKGCLDTFLFRSRQRGNGQVYAELVRRVLNAIHSWLSDDPPGKYVVLTPRPKLHAVRDFHGFASFERRALDLSTLQRADLHSPNSVKTSTQDPPPSTPPIVQDKKKQQQQQSTDRIFLYHCIKDTHYSVDHPAFRIAVDDPSEEDACPGCHVSFYNFRKGEDVRGRGRPFWYREWRGHKRHCNKQGKSRKSAKACNQ